MNLPDTQKRHVLKVLTTSAAWMGLSASICLPSARAQNTSTRRSESAPAQLRIGYQKSAVNLIILKQLGLLEQRFPQSRVQWIEFPAGPQLLEALAVGSLDFGLTGDSPPVFAQAAGKELYYVGVEPPKPLSSAILVLDTSPIKDLKGLKGQKIALQKGSSSHYMLVKAVERAGLKWGDIQPIYLAPADARAAFERKAVDAWAIWDPYYAATELSLRTRVLATGKDLSSNHSLYLAAVPFTEQYPQTLHALFDALTKADLYVQEHRPESIKLISAFSGLDAGVVSLFLERRQKSPVHPLNATVIAEQQKVADAFAQLALIPKPIRVADIVWKP